MTQKQAAGWRLAAAFALAVLALTAGTFGAGTYGPASVAFADDDPDYLVLNPEHE